MNTVELQHRFDLEAKKYLPHPVMSTIVQDYINYAYQQYITEKYDSLINPIEKFEVTERITRILAPLLKDFTESTSSNIVSLTTNSPYGYYIILPSDVQYIVKEKGVLNYVDCNSIDMTKECDIIPIKHHRINSNRKNPFVKPIDDQIWRVNFSGNKVELILYDGVTLASYSCRYIKKHLQVNFETGVTMEIDDSVHEEIVLRSVNIYFNYINNNKK